MSRPSFTTQFDRRTSSQALPPLSAASSMAHWRMTLPVLTGGRVTLRNLLQADAAPLLGLLTTDEVTRFMSPPPTTVEGFKRFIAWADKHRAGGDYMCFAVVPRGGATAIGIIQVRQLEQGFRTAEWGFVLGPAFWGTGLFVEAAELVLAFAFDSVGVHRLEARTAVANGRGNGALRKLGARREAILRESFCRGGRHFDQVLWSILDEDWRRAKANRGPGADI